MSINRYVVIFDLFGTLIEELENDWKKSILFMKKEILLDEDDDKIVEVTDTFRKIYMSDRSITHREAKMSDQIKLFQDHIGFKKEFDYIELEYQLFIEGRKTKLFDGVIEVLEFFKERNYLMYVMSNTIYSVNVIKRYLMEYGILDYFTDIFTSSDFGYRKPSQKYYNYVFNIIQSKTNIEKNEVFFVGNDFTKDVIGSKIFGFEPFWISSDKNYISDNIINVTRLENLIQFKEYINSNYVYLSAIQDNYSTSDGPGNRLVVYFQGCNVHCQGCHNQESWELYKGLRYSVNNLTLTIMTKLSKYIKNVTISGGEPLLQECALVTLLYKLKKANLNICLYTSYDFEKVRENILCNIDYLKTGKYIHDLRTTTNGFFGSTNQKMWRKEKDIWIDMKIE